MVPYLIAKKHVNGSALVANGLINANVMCMKKSGAIQAEIIHFVMGQRAGRKIHAVSIRF